MSITLKDKSAADVVYNFHRMTGDRANYIGPAHNDTNTDTLILSSSSPKRTAMSFGNRRSTLKVVQTITVATPDGATEHKDAKIEISVSLPVGMTNDQLDELQARGFSVPDMILDAFMATGQIQFGI